MSKRMYPVIHFEMPAEDSGRARKFYESVFGWEILQLGPEMGDFALAYTTDTDRESRMPKKPGAINGGFYKKSEPDQRTKITILVDDMQKMLASVKTAGGKVLPAAGGGEVDDMPGIGLFASFIDPEGNVVTIYEDRSPNPSPEQKALLD